MPTDMLVARFIERFKEQGGFVELVDSWDEALDSIAREARAAAAPVAVATCGEEHLEGIRARLGGVSRLVGPRAPPIEISRCGIGVTFPIAGIAETGSILELNYDDSDRLVSTLPPIHIAYLESRRLVGRLLEVAPILKQGLERGAFSATIISGPSRTADIELRQVIGVHGPHVVKILLEV
ncbi:MAG: LUD domain-containing protein [Nitrososphaerota archaeon]